MNLNLGELDGIIWDMDGVLVDVSKSYREVIKQTASSFLNRKVQKEEVDKVKSIVGFNNDWDATFAVIENITDPNQVKRNSDNYQKYKDKFQELYLGSENLSGAINTEKLFITRMQLEKLNNRYKKMAIVTGRPKEEAKYIIDKFNLSELFKEVICLEDVVSGKPDPEGINKVIKSMGLDKTLYIGDSPSDIEAAKRASIPSLFIGDSELGDFNFKTTDDLLTFLL